MDAGDNAVKKPTTVEIIGRLRRRGNRTRLRLVGDEGVYLMQNGQSIGEGRQPLVYANECNPEKLPFDEWWRTNARPSAATMASSSSKPR